VAQAINDGNAADCPIPIDLPGIAANRFPG
jgi:hypothetical protein